MVLRFALVAALAAVLIPARAGAAQAPSIDPLAPCYVSAQQDQRQAVAFAAHGFSPNAFIDVYVDDVLQMVPPGSPAPQADINGDLLGGSVSAPYLPFGVRNFTLRLAQQGNANNTVATTSK